VGGCGGGDGRGCETVSLRFLHSSGSSEAGRDLVVHTPCVCVCVCVRVCVHIHIYIYIYIVR